ncbi:MAG: ATP-binding protein [Salinibacter sp.]|uniref:ATP-binding protein n=1 Tax=Salinibacter sp. TaxID=2065818 RepID=UPI0035D46C4A
MAPHNPQTSSQGEDSPENRAEALAQDQPDFAGAVLEALPGIVVVFDDENRLVWGNQNLQEATGHAAQTLRGMTPSTLFADASVQTVQQILETVRAGTEPAAEDVALVTERGRTVSCTFTGERLPDGAERAGWVVGVGRNPSMLDVEAQALRRERDRLAALYAGLPSPVVHYEVRGGEAIVQGVNTKFEEVFGVSQGAISGQALDAHIAPGERARRAESLTRQVVEEGSVQAEVIRDTEDGPRHFRLNSVLFSGGSRPEGYAIYTDITRQKEREQTLRDEQQALRSMYRTTADQDASFEQKVQRLIDLGREYLSLPYGFLTRISEDTQEIVQASGTHPLLQPGESCPLSESYCRKTIQKGSLLAVRDAPNEGWTGDPAYEMFDLGTYIGSQILVGEELYGTFCFAATEARDTAFSEREQTFVELMTRWASYELEQRRATERLERQNERLDSFAGLVTHDLRNPLNVAKGRLELAREEGEDEEPPSHLAAVGRALDRMDAIIDDVLTLTWGDQDLGAEDLEHCDLARLVRESWEHVDGSDATLQVESDRVVLRADPARLQRLLENLFRNAVEHGGEAVSVRVGELPGGFYVEDDGSGIPEEKQEKVLEGGYSSQEEGTGLGLSIVQGIAEAHGWSILVTEGREGGARFEITDVDVGD